MDSEVTKSGFPALVIRKDGFVPVGAFAEATAVFLRPDPQTTRSVDALLRTKNVGLVAHFYMDPEVQGVLSSCAWAHIHISDSLAMADHAIAMARAGVSAIAVLGVDFMSENVRAMLDASGFGAIPVYRLSERRIGCSLAEAAEMPAYTAYLERAASVPTSLHVIYINTSLEVKARGHAIVPTITCTSSNVVQTVLQAFAQIPNVHVWFGPDTYMGENLAKLFARLPALGDAPIAQLHAAHDHASIQRLLPRFHHFEQGACIVHHMFGASVVDRVRRYHSDAFVTAHLEVPGEMFELALEAQGRGRGVVGSTSDILNFIDKRVEEAVLESTPRRLSFVLGTEAGMITSIVRRVESALAKGPNGIDVEIVFPVAADAIATTGQADLPVVPGVAAGEGCSTAGGCATCPYMKMNSLDALEALLGRIGENGALAAHHPRAYTDQIGGRSLADLGTEPILSMRSLQQTGALPEKLVGLVLGQTGLSPAAIAAR